MKGLKKKVGVMSGLAALALVGSAFAVWHFGENVNKSIDGDYIITKAYDAGTIGDISMTWGQSASLNDGAGPHAVKTTDKILILDQPDNGEDRKDVHWAYENENNDTLVALKAAYTYGVEDPDHRAAEPRLWWEMKFTGGLADVVDFAYPGGLSYGTWSPDTYITLPTLSYKAGMTPGTISAYNSMLTALEGSKVVFTFHADFSTAPLQETQGLEYALNEEGTEYSVSGPGTADLTKQIVIPKKYMEKKVSNIGNGAFGGYEVQSVVLQDSITTIADNAFNSTTITSFTIPSTVVSIGDSAFFDCSELTSITLEEPSSLTTIGPSAFIYDNIASFTIPASVTSIGAGAFSYCQNFQNFTFESGSLFQENSDHTLILSSDGTNAIAGACGASSIEIPASVTTIGQSCFEGNSLLASLTIPSSVTKIGLQSFNYCSALSQVNIPSSVTEIDDCAFAATAITSMTIPNTVTTLGNGVFTNCKSLVSIVFPSSITSISFSMLNGCSALTSVTLPSTITTIGSFAFANCTSLSSLTLPRSITEIDSCAFLLDTNLLSLNYEGTKAEWNAISKPTDLNGRTWETGLSVASIVCSDGTIML